MQAKKRKIIHLAKEIVHYLFVATVTLTIGYALIHFVFIFGTRPNNGIVMLDGYEDAVVLCGEAITINYGHQDDAKLQELYKLAEVECGKVDEWNEARK